MIKTSRIENKNLFYTLFISLLLLAVYFRIVDHGWEDIVQSDGKGYFGYLPAIFTYHDLNFKYFDNGELQMPFGYKWSWLYLVDGENVIKYPAGVAFLLTPFYLVASILTFVFGFERTGYSFFYQSFVSLAAITYSTLGIRYLILLLQDYIKDRRIILIVSIATLFGTNLLNYTVYEPCMSHVYSFFSIGASIFYFKKFLETKNYTSLYLFSFFAGVVVLIRPVNGVFVFALPFLIESISNLKSELSKLFFDKRKLLIAIIIGLAIVSIQPILWKLQTGKWYVWTYVDEGFNWSNPRILKVLFSYKKGLFVYTPFMFLVFPALVYFILKRDFYKLVTFLLFLIPTIYIISSWWCWYYGGSFGQRAFIEFYPIFILFWAPLLNSISNRLGKSLLYTFLIACTYLNVIQSYQYMKHIIHYDSMDKEKYWSVFLRTSSEYQWKVFENNNASPPTSVFEGLKSKYFNDFEGCPDNWKNCQFKMSDEALSGNQVLEIKLDGVLSPELEVPLDINVNDKLSVFVKGWVLAGDQDANTQICIILSDTTHKKVFEEQFVIGENLLDEYKNNWQSFKVETKLPLQTQNTKYYLNVFLKCSDPLLRTYDDIAVFIYEPK